MDFARGCAHTPPHEKHPSCSSLAAAPAPNLRFPSWICHIRLLACLAGTLQLVEERTGDGTAIDASGEVVDRDGATLRLKAGGAFYAPSPVQCVAIHGSRIAAGAQSGELYHLEVM